MKKHMPERRAEDRLLCSDLVEIHWRDKSGRKRHATALLEDISACGACLQLENRLPLGTVVQIDQPGGKLEGTVCYCVFQEIGHFAGVQFGPASRWSAAKFQPQHLLDLRELVLRSSSQPKPRPQ